MSVIRYFAGVLSIAAIFAVAGCAEKGDGGGYDGPSVATSAKLHFISRLSDDALFASDADADAVGDYIGTAMNGDDVTVAFLDRTDMSGAADAAQILLDTRKWSSFIALGQTGAEDFDVTTFVFNEPAELVTAYQIEQGCYVSGRSVELSGTLTNYDDNGDVTNVRAVTTTVPLFSCRLNSQEQVTAFSSVTMTDLRSASQNFMLVGTVKNDLLASLQEEVPAANSGYTAVQVAAGPDYTIFLLFATRYWGYNGVEETSVAGDVTAYAVDFAWK